MALLDVSDVLDDPDFLTQIKVFRVQSRTDERGETVLEKTPILITACVQPIRTQELARLPDAERLVGGITVYSRVPFISGDGPLSADIVEVGTIKYVVVSTNDWQLFGRGYTAAQCAMFDLQADSEAKEGGCG